MTAQLAAPVTITSADVRMRDGASLATDVSIVDDGQARPALVVRSPYSRAMSRQGCDPVALARQGWAVVVQDVRGRFDSEGEFDPFRHEGPDGADTIGWVVEQPWCDGRVAGFGGSYLGFSQWLTALEQPPALRVIAPVSAGADVRHAMMYEGGALQLGLAAGWACDVDLADPATPPDRRQALRELAADHDRLFATPLAIHPLRELFPPFQRWLDPTDDAYWRATDATARLPEVDLPVFQVAGWYDIFCEDALVSHDRMCREAPSAYARRSQRLIVGPWTHATMLLPLTPEFDFGAEASGAAQGLPGGQLAWLEQALDGEPVEGGISVFVMGSGRWVDLESWPPPATATRLYLSSRRGANSLDGDGVLTADPPELGGTDRFRYDPHDPVPTRGGRILGPFRPMAGPVDQRPVEERDDVLVYTSPALETDVTVIGTVSATVVFASEGRSADVTVKLVDVWPDGRALNVVDSVRRVDVVPGEPVAVEVSVGSTAMCFLAGHRIRVEVSSSNFPRLDRNPSTGVPARDATELEPAWQTVHHGGEQPSFLELPVTAGRLEPSP